MTPKQVQFDPHALKAMRALEAGELHLQVSRDDVRNLLHVGERRFLRRGGDVGSYWARTAMFKGHPLAVIYYEDASLIVVKTVYVVGEYD